MASLFSLIFSFMKEFEEKYKPYSGIFTITRMFTDIYQISVLKVSSRCNHTITVFPFLYLPPIIFSLLSLYLSAHGPMAPNWLIGHSGSIVRTSLFLCFPKEEHIVAALSVRSSVHPSVRHTFIRNISL